MVRRHSSSIALLADSNDFSRDDFLVSEAEDLALALAGIEPADNWTAPGPTAPTGQGGCTRTLYPLMEFPSRTLVVRMLSSPGLRQNLSGFVNRPGGFRDKVEPHREPCR